MHGTCGLNNPWHHLRKMSSWVGNPGRPPYVIPCGSAGLKKKDSSRKSADGSHSNAYRRRKHNATSAVAASGAIINIKLLKIIKENTRLVGSYIAVKGTGADKVAKKIDFKPHRHQILSSKSVIETIFSPSNYVLMFLFISCK